MMTDAPTLPAPGVPSLLTHGLECASRQPTSIARAYIASLGAPPPLFVADRLHVWESAPGAPPGTPPSWVPIDRDELERRLWRALEVAYTVRTTATTRSLDPIPLNSGVISNVASAIEALTSTTLKAPCFIPSNESPNFILPFSNAILPIEPTAATFATSGRLDFVVQPRDPSWFGYTLPVPFDPNATCPTWERCCHEWSQGDPDWVELLERVFAACLMPFRGWAKIPLFYGLSRSGKSTITEVLRALCPPRYYLGTSITDAIDSFSSTLLARSRVILFAEVGELEHWQRSSFASLLRRIVGNDDTLINEKHVRMKEGRFSAIPIIHSHYILDLPNEQGGITTKILPLHFRTQFLEKPDLTLLPKLIAELPGIALRIARAAVRLVAAPPESQLPITAASSALKRRIEIEANPADAFLHAHFVRREGLYTPSSLIYPLRDQWEATEGLRLRRRDGTRVPNQRLLEYLEERSSWGVHRYKDPRTQEHCLKGCYPRTDHLKDSPTP